MEFGFNWPTSCLLVAILSDVIRNVRFITKETDELVIRQGDQGDWYAYVRLYQKVFLFLFRISLLVATVYLYVFPSVFFSSEDCRPLLRRFTNPKLTILTLTLYSTFGISDLRNIGRAPFRKRPFADKRHTIFTGRISGPSCHP